MMPKIASETIVKNNVRYYTTNYFAKQTFVTARNARKYLSRFDNVEGYSNPKLYTKEVMMAAIATYEANKPQEEFEERRERRRAEIEEAKRIEFFESLENEDPNKVENDPGYQRELDALKTVNENYREKLVVMMLKHLLYLKGYEFNEELFRSDLEYHAFAEEFREEGVMRTKEHRKIVKRIESSHAYLLKK